MPTIATDGLPDDPDERDQVRQLEAELRDHVNPTLARTLNGTFDDEIYLTTSWLGAIHRHVRRRQGDPRRSTSQWSRERYLAAITNRLGLEYETVLDADPVDELTLLIEALEHVD